MTPYDARNLTRSYSIPLDKDFHALDSAAVESLRKLAVLVRYREPKNANGSRARCFHAYLRRIASRKES